MYLLQSLCNAGFPQHLVSNEIPKILETLKMSLSNDISNDHVDYGILYKIKCHLIWLDKSCPHTLDQTDRQRPSSREKH